MESINRSGDNARLKKFSIMKRVFTWVFFIGIGGFALGMLLTAFVKERSELFDRVDGIMIGVGLLMFLGGGIGVSLSNGALKNIIEGYIPTLLGSILDRFDGYDRRAGLEGDCYDKRLGFPIFHRVTGKEDLVRGAIHGVDFEFCEFRLDEDRTDPRDDNNERKYVNVFYGAMIICKHNRNLSGELTIGNIPGNPRGATTNNEDFNREFGVLVDEPADAAKILEDSYLQSLYELYQRTQRGFGICFSADGNIYIAIKNMDLFEAGDVSDIESAEQRIRQEMAEVGDFIGTIAAPFAV